MVKHFIHTIKRLVTNDGLISRHTFSMGFESGGTKKKRRPHEMKQLQRCSGFHRYYDMVRSVAPFTASNCLLQSKSDPLFDKLLLKMDHLFLCLPYKLNMD